MTILINRQQPVPPYLPTIHDFGRLIHALTDPLCANLLEAKSPRLGCCATRHRSLVQKLQVVKFKFLQNFKILPQTGHLLADYHRPILDNGIRQFKRLMTALKIAV